MRRFVAHIPEWVWISILFVISHTLSLTLLPVFADEAIYIRWAQLIQDDASRYAFFSMADGKPPLFMWLVSVVLRFVHDPLLGGRLVAVIVGLVTVFVFRALAREFTKDAKATVAITAFTFLMPFWFFYHRMALMDGLLALFIAAAFLWTIRLSKVLVSPQDDQAKTRRYKTITCIYAVGLAFGGAMWTKTPALFVIPIIAITPVFVWLTRGKRQLTTLWSMLLLVALGGIIGTGLFLILRISPLFGSLFTRSTDFTFTTKDLIAGEWHYVLFKSFLRNVGWIAWYMTPEIFVLASLGLFTKSRKSILFLLLCSFLFFLPLTLFGRVLWPRYFLPVSVFLTLAAALSFASCAKYRLGRFVCVVLLSLGLLQSIGNMWVALSAPQNIPFVSEDRSQYLSEWSAGFGNKEVRDYIRERQRALMGDKTKKIVVLTEGSFGTLPDGLLMYFHGSAQTQGVEIHGIGVSVAAIPTDFLQRAKTDEVYYMLNSHRFGIVDRSVLQKVFEVKRPDGPSLLFFRVAPKG